MPKRNTLKQEYYKTSLNQYWKDSEGKPTLEYVKWLEEKVLKNKEILTFNKEEEDSFIEDVAFLNSQNLSGRETEDELYKQGIKDCFEDLTSNLKEKI